MSDSITETMTSGAVSAAEERLQTLLPGVYRGRTDEVQPVSMGSAPLAFDVDGNVAWDQMWGSFCDLAMAGGPPHKGKLLEPETEESILAEPERYAVVCDEIVRGIQLAARLQAELDSLQGWIRIRCLNRTMAQWMLRAITMENVSVRLDGDAIMLPAGPAFRIPKEIKNVITVTAKTTHYWTGHLHRLQQLGIANLFASLESDLPLLQPSWDKECADADVRSHVQTAVGTSLGLRPTNHAYTRWMGFDTEDVTSAIVTMRRLVASNVLCRREETAIFLPFNPIDDPEGEHLALRVGDLVARSL